MTTVITKRLGYLSTAERILRSAGPVEYCEDQQRETVERHLRNARVVVATKDVVIDDAILDQAPGLDVIATPTAGFDWVDVVAATAHGIPVIANTGAAADSVAEFTLGLVLALTRRIVAADRDLHAGHAWPAVRDRYSRTDHLIGQELSASTVAVIGLGHIGQKVADKLRMLRPARLIGYDPYVSAEQAARLGVDLRDEVAACVREADIVLLHVPLTPATTKLINADTLSRMRPGVLLVNCSRGQVVDQAALVDALSTGRLGGAALDVFEEEPLPADSPLRSLDNVILTPHIAGVTAQSDEARAREISERILTCLAGAAPAGLVNPEVWASRRSLSELKESS